MKQLVHTIEYEGSTFEYDANSIKRWDVQKALAAARKGQYPAIEVYDALFMGHADEVAERLDNDATKVDELASRIISAVGSEDGSAKN